MTLRPAPDERAATLNARAAVPSGYGNNGDGDGDDDDDTNVAFTTCNGRGERAVFGELGKGEKVR